MTFPRYVTDGSYGIRVNVANARYWHTSPEMKVQFRINSMGMRSDREYSFDKPQDTIRVVGLGDSFTLGYEADVTETYLYRLEELLKADGYPVEVINLGVSGYGTAEELIMLKEFGFRFHPDVVIAAFYQNDLADNVRSNLYRLDKDGRLIRASSSYLPAVGIRNKLYSFWLYRWLAENSQLLSLARESISVFVKRKMVTARDTTNVKHRNDSYPSILTGRLLDRIKAECSERGVEFLLLDIPRHTLAESHLAMTSLEQVLPEEVVQVAPSLRAQGPNTHLYRRRGSFHWTPQAHEIAAMLLAQKLCGKLDDLQLR